MTCTTIELGGGITMIGCSRGERRKSCSCGEIATRLCDYELKGDKKGKTCSAPICARCAVRTDGDRDLCPTHDRWCRAQDTAAKKALDAEAQQLEIESQYKRNIGDAWLARLVAKEEHDDALCWMHNNFPDWHFDATVRDEPVSVHGMIDGDASWRCDVQHRELCERDDDGFLAELRDEPPPWTERDPEPDSVFVHETHAWFCPRYRARAIDIDMLCDCDSIDVRAHLRVGWPTTGQNHVDERERAARGQSISSKVEHVKRAQQTRDHACHWTGCGKQCKPAMWGCARHWSMLPKRLRDAIWREYRSGQEVTLTPSRAYLAVVHEVEAWILLNHPPDGTPAASRARAASAIERVSFQEAANAARMRDSSRRDGKGSR